MTARTPGTWPTPDQLWQELNDAEPDQRASMLADMIDAGQARLRCFELNHDGQRAQLEQLHIQYRNASSERDGLLAARQEMRDALTRISYDFPLGSTPAHGEVLRLRAIADNALRAELGGSESAGTYNGLETPATLTGDLGGRPHP